MKHIKKHLQKISKETMKKWVTTLVLLFFAMVMIFQKDAPTQGLQFIRNADEAFIHGAANENPPPSQRDYLFQNEAGNPEYQWQITKWQELEVEPSGPAETMDNLINPNDIAQVVGNTWTQSGQIYSWTMYTWNMGTIVWTTGTQAIQKTGTIITGSLNCITPWKEEVKNKDFVLAYEQRKDVNTICNIEKRVCTDWVLWGTFIWASCQEDVVYEYHKAEVISYNQKNISEYVQPNTPVNEWGQFDNQWQINTTEQPTTSRWTSNSPVTTQPEVTQTPLSTKLSCTTPRGQKIKHGQFVKAYKAPRGFLDLACNVEIRPCINGNLKGTFTYSKCTFNNTTYADYLKAWSPASSTGFLFFERIKSVLRFGR